MHCFITLVSWRGLIYTSAAQRDPKVAGAWDSEPASRTTRSGAFTVPGRRTWTFRRSAAKSRGSEKTELCSRGTLNPCLGQRRGKDVLCRSEALGICTAPPRIFGVQSRGRRMIREWHEPQTGFVPFPYGAPPGTRTLDPLIKSQLLYQLS